MLTEGEVLRRRTPNERAAYVDGFEAGVKAALGEVRRLNFGDAADRAQSRVAVLLDAVIHTKELEC